MYTYMHVHAGLPEYVYSSVSLGQEWCWEQAASCWEAHYCQANLKIINCQVDAF